MNVTAAALYDLPSSNSTVSVLAVGGAASAGGNCWSSGDTNVEYMSVLGERNLVLNEKDAYRDAYFTVRRCDHYPKTDVLRRTFPLTAITATFTVYRSSNADGQ